MLRVHILPRLGGRRIGTITRHDVQVLVNEWAALAAPRTVRRRYGVLGSVFTFAAVSGWVARSPARGIKLPAIAGTRSRHLEPVEVAAIALATPIEYRPMVWLGAMLGLRWSEVAGLRVGRLDLLRRTVTVAEALTRNANGRPVFTAPKSIAGARTLAMPAALADMLAEHLTQLGKTAADADDLVFSAPEGGPLRYANWRRRVWVSAVAAAGCDGAGFHDLRRANATGLVLAGVDLKTAQTRLGHSDPRMTIGLYAQATSDADKRRPRPLAHTFQELRGKLAGSTPWAPDLIKRRVPGAGQTRVDLLGRYSNPDNVSRLNLILSGQGRDRPSHRPVPSLKHKQTRLADSDRIEVLERYSAGETANALAGAYGVNRATVFAILQRAGIKSRYRILTDLDVAAATDMYEAGQSLASIAKHFGVADRTILNAFRRFGVATRARGTNQWSQPVGCHRDDDCSHE